MICSILLSDGVGAAAERPASETKELVMQRNVSAHRNIGMPAEPSRGPGARLSADESYAAGTLW